LRTKYLNATHKVHLRAGAGNTCPAEQTIRPRRSKKARTFPTRRLTPRTCAGVEVRYYFRRLARAVRFLAASYVAGGEA